MVDYRPLVDIIDPVAGLLMEKVQKIKIYEGIIATWQCFQSKKRNNIIRRI